MNVEEDSNSTVQDKKTDVKKNRRLTELRSAIGIQRSDGTATLASPRKGKRERSESFVRTSASMDATDDGEDVNEPTKPRAAPVLQPPPSPSSTGGFLNEGESFTSELEAQVGNGRFEYEPSHMQVLRLREEFRERIEGMKDDVDAVNEWLDSIIPRNPSWYEKVPDMKGGAEHHGYDDSILRWMALEVIVENWGRWRIAITDNGRALDTHCICKPSYLIGSCHNDKNVDCPAILRASSDCPIIKSAWFDKKKNVQ